MFVVLSLKTRLHTLADTRSPTVESKEHKFRPSDNHDWFWVVCSKLGETGFLPFEPPFLAYLEMARHPESWWQTFGSGGGSIRGWWVTIRGPPIYKILWKPSPSVPGTPERIRTLDRLAGKGLSIQLHTETIKKRESLSGCEACLDIASDHSIHERCQHGNDGCGVLI